MKQELRRCPMSNVGTKCVLNETGDPDQATGIEWGKERQGVNACRPVVRVASHPETWRWY